LYRKKKCERNSEREKEKRLKKKNYFTYSAGDEKWLIIVKFNYYEPFDYSVGDTLTG
jgi:hypothetical protein